MIFAIVGEEIQHAAQEYLDFLYCNQCSDLTQQSY